jgi:hypothetical protein
VKVGVKALATAALVVATAAFAVAAVHAKHAASPRAARDEAARAAGDEPGLARDESEARRDTPRAPVVTAITARGAAPGAEVKTGATENAARVARAPAGKSAIDAARAKELDAVVAAAPADPALVARAKELVEGAAHAPVPGADLMATAVPECGRDACKLHAPSESVEALRPFFEGHLSGFEVMTYDPNDGSATEIVYVVPRAETASAIDPRGVPAAPAGDAR